MYWFRNDAAVDYMREEVGADVCVLLVDDDEANGLAAALGAEDETEAFCVVYYDAATGNYSFGHEIGHLLNAEHQREGSSSHARHGYLYQGTVWWRTIMATSSAGGTRIQYWSNPEIDDPYDDTPMGTYANENNVGAALNVNAPDISDFLPTGTPSAPAAPSNLVIPNEAQVGQNPQLDWDASTTLGVNTYKVYRCENYVGSCAATLQVIATTSETNYTDTEIEITTKDNSDDRYRYHVTAVQFGLESADSNYEEVWAGVAVKAAGEDETTMLPPSEFKLHQNYPNPFNPVTEIRYDVPETFPIRLIVYDIAGREVARLVDGTVEAGCHSVLFDATGLASGVYIYKLEAGAFNQTARMIIAK